MTDDQTVEQMGALPRVRGLLVRQGTSFASSFSSFPLCCPSRATYLTGQYAHNNGVLGNKASEQGGYGRLKPTHANTLPAWMREAPARYRTAHIGKYLNNYGNPGAGHPPREVPPGWDDWHGAVDPFTYRYWHFRLNENGRLVRYGRPPRGDVARYRRCDEVRRRRYSSDVYTDKAVRYIDRHAREPRPFLLSVAYLAPHGPAGATGPSGAAADRRCRRLATRAPSPGRRCRGRRPSTRPGWRTSRASSAGPS